ncbi:MAG: hypothetical protein EOP34_06010 [Rickettsiales bacterium]|nr:MAG: hypothetical protein EOP34_06010 [Rickettsiales bacterium]
MVSKPEIKHDNNEVLVTVYLFNKKKISLLKTLHMQSNEMHNLDQKTKTISSPYTGFSKGLRKHRNKKIITARSKRNLRSTRKPVFFSKLLSTKFKSINSIFNKLAFKTKVKSSALR